MARAVVDVGKSGAEAFVGTPAVCAALVRHFHDLFPSLHTLGGGDGETEAGSIYLSAYRGAVVSVVFL